MQKPQSARVSLLPPEWGKLNTYKFNETDNREKGKKSPELLASYLQNCFAYSLGVQVPLCKTYKR